MANATSARFKFIGHALAGDGPFRPAADSVTGTLSGTAANASYLVQYPRESAAKFARRNEIAFFESPLFEAASRFVGYLSMSPAVRQLGHELYERVADDMDGKQSDVDIWMQSFAINAKARGSMLALVDMPVEVPANLRDQVADRAAPYWTPIAPEAVTGYAIGRDGRFDFVEFPGVLEIDGKNVDVTWRFDRAGWQAVDKQSNVKLEGAHPLGECPVLIFTELGDFPCFGPFAAIADLSKRLFNLDSELDEILRAQTFSLLTMQAPDGATNDQKMAAAQSAGETIGTSNMVVHTGSTPQFIAPPDGPAGVYMTRIADVRKRIDRVGLTVTSVNEAESGLAMQMRFHAVNGELSRFAARMEDFERRAWDLSRRWLGMDAAPDVQWPRDFNLADVQSELQILADMQAAGMPQEVIAEQQRRITSVQFRGLDQEAQDRMTAAIDERIQSTQGGAT